MQCKPQFFYHVAPATCSVILNIFQFQPDIRHEIVIPPLLRLLEKTFIAEYFFNSLSANFTISPNSSKSPDLSFSPRFRTGADRGSSATFVVEVANSESLADLMRDKERCLGGTSRAMIFLGISLPWHVPRPGYPVICTVSGSVGVDPVKCQSNL
jgi:hypothetical protein